MPNWKKVITSGSDASLNSLNVTSAFTASNIIYPTSDGSNNQSLVTDGAGNLTFGNPYSDNTVVYGKNLSGTTIEKGTPLYFTGSGTVGNLVGVFPADASNPARMPAGGIAGEQMLNEAEGVVLLDGFINGVDTSAFGSGDLVYVGVGGGYTNVAPTGSSNSVQSLGYVEKVSDTNGSGIIKGPGVFRSVPNIQQGYVWVGNADDVPTPIATSSLSVASADQTSQAITFNNGGTGAVSGTTFNGSTARTISYNTIGAQPLLTNPVTGTGTTNYLSKFTGTSTLGNSLVYDDGTNVGIGTTDPVSTWLSSFDPSTGNSIFKLTSEGWVVTPYLTGLASYFPGQGARPIIWADNAGTNIQSWDNNATDGVSIRSSNKSVRLFVREDGNVGIGTTSPSEKLEVDGKGLFTGTEVKVENASDPSIQVSDTDTNYKGAMRWLSSDNVLEFYTRYAGTYYTSNLVLDRGNVGIGTTSPGAKLDVYDTQTKNDTYTTSINVLHTGGVDTNNRVIQAGKFEQRLSGGANTKGTGVLGIASKGGDYGSVATGLHGLARLTLPVTVNNADMIYRGVVGEIHMDGTNSVNLDDTAYSFYADATIETGAHLKSYYGLFLNAPTNNGTILNRYGIYQEDSTSINFLNGNVGIGTTSPFSTLEVSKNQNGHGITITQENAGDGYHSKLTFRGSDGSGGFIQTAALAAYQQANGANGYLRFFAGATEGLQIKAGGSIQLPTYGAGFLTTDASGNVSVSTSTSLDTLDDVTGRGNTTTNSIEVGGLQVEDTIGIKRSGVNAITTLQQTGEGLILNSPSGYHPFVIQYDGSELFRFSNLGNLGIGTTSPSTTLQLSKANTEVLADNPAWPAGILEITDTSAYNAGTGATIVFRKKRDSTGNQVTVGAIAGEGIAGNSQLSFWTGDSAYMGTAPKMVIKNTGNVGIGTTNPTEALMVEGWIRVANNTGIKFNTSASSGDPTLNIDSSAHWNFLNTAGNNLLKIDNGGNVGIGTTSPNSRVEISGTTGSYNSGIGFVPTGTGARAYRTFIANDGSFRFDDATAGATRLTINSAGNVGIGTTSPNYKLDVAGSINAGGKVTYTKAYTSLDTTGNAVAGLLASSNGASSLFTFTCHGNTGGYQKIVYSCHNAAGIWNTAKVIDEGTNDFDVTASANGSTITFTFKSTNGTRGYSPKVTVEAIGSAINSTYA